MELSGGLSYPLSILVKAVAFRNLSSASSHVGLSQPQLSRIIAKLEREVGVSLLDRQVRRKAVWTADAMKLAEMFHSHQRRLEAGIKSLQVGGKIRQLHVGTLEGLAPAALRISESLFKIPPIEMVTLDVLDLGELESKFINGDLDLMLSTRVPGRSKPKFTATLGFQTLDPVNKGENFAVFSSFEFARLRKKSLPPTFVSNSLFVRKQWLEKSGGEGWLPSEVHERPRKDAVEVLLLGGEWLEQKLWDNLIQKFKK